MKKKHLIHILVPTVLSIVSYFVSINFIFKVPNPTGIGFADVTYMFGFKVAMSVLGVSSIVSAILYIGRKNQPKS